MNHANSGLAHSTNCSPQLTLENGEMAAKARENEAKVAELYKYDHNEVIRAINANDMEYLRTKLSRFSPIPILSTAQIKPEHKKNGYEQVKYEWINEEYTYISRWHTHTPNAPEYSHDTWVVERKRPGIGAGRNHRPKIHEVLVGKNRWIDWRIWHDAVIAKQNNSETKEQRELLDNGHWDAEK